MLQDKELPRPLSAKFKEDFAYPTVKDRLPVILTKVVDYVYRLRTEVDGKHEEAGLEDLKLINSFLSGLKNELQTDKPLKELTDTWLDVALWNKYLAQEKDVLEKNEGFPSWFSSPWLYIECYFYRRIHSAVQHSALLKDLDPFGSQKQLALTSSIRAMAALASYLLKVCETTNGDIDQFTEDEFVKFFQISLWGNKCDLSISAGTENSQQDDSLGQLSRLRSYLLVDDTMKVWNKLKGLKESSAVDPVQLDIILDNAGFELFTDLCLAEFLISMRLVHRVVFHPKSFPWFVSDVTQKDLDWTLDQLSTSSHESLAKLGRLWHGRFDDKSFAVFHHNFWTLPHDYAQMQHQAPDLYKELEKSRIILFKGDLNYRKLAGDRKWDPTTDFQTALGNFHPAPLCALRTLKCDLAIGLKPGQAEEVQKKDEKWMLTGDYGVIQLSAH